MTTLPQPPKSLPQQVELAALGPVLASAVTRFANAHPELKDPAQAATRCHEMSDALAHELTGAGFEAQAWGSLADWLGLAERVPTPWLQDDSHVVCVVATGGGWWLVDLTAAQYGRSEFPLCHFTPELPPRDPWLLTPEQAAEQMELLQEHLAAGGSLF